MDNIKRGKEIADTLRKLGSKGQGYPSPGSERKMLVAYITHLEEDNGASREMNLSRIKWAKEQREIIEHARGIAQADERCDGWDDQWCPTSCKWWRICEPLEAG